MATIVIGSVPADEFALNHTLDEFPEMRFESEQIIKSGDEAVMPLLWARNTSGQDLQCVLESDPTVGDVTSLAAFDDEVLYRMEWTGHIRLLLQMLTNSEGTILDAYGRDDEWRLRVLFPTRDRFSSTHDFCEEHGLTFEIDSIREMEGQPSGRYGLTDGQYEALVTATRQGYYDIPQEKTLEELADELGVSHQALSEQLRRGNRSLIEDTLLVGAPHDLR
ncbi:helix-turn-helix domain-containing protein [Haloarchaeobius amylolyticus]|uniref:helix-turn-helix domain-containing protein n=1 Tax=Haloarchaeobius amylolyticus TaxID=1198296 RepID=UPI00226D73D9|nr:helix-turn-helix domain-containing protein [Haloarchaeobius amylolyticus]